LEVTLVDTGENTMTGGRLRRVAKYLGDEDFALPMVMVLVR
jgi:glucose-1-phosphate cytidylyltransferase